MALGQVIDISRARSHHSNQAESRGSDQRDFYEVEIDICERLLACYPNHYQAWNYRSYLLASTEQYAEAAESYRRTVELKATEPRIWCNYGVVLDKLSCYDQAIDCYNQALSLRPSYFKAVYRRSKDLHRLHAYHRAVESYAQALELRPDFYKVWYYRGKALLQLKQLDAAISSFQQALDLHDSDSKVWVSLGKAYLKQQENTKALEHFAKALELSPADGVIWSYQAYAQKRLGRLEASLASFDQAVALDPLEHQLWYQRALLLIDLKRYGDAAESLTQSLKQQAYSAGGWLAMGWVQQHLGDYERAIEAYDKSLAVEPNQPFAFYNQARCHALLHHADWAMEHLRRAISLRPHVYLEKAQTDPVLKSFYQEDMWLSPHEDITVLEGGRDESVEEVTFESP
ncbi:MAG: tetratricopeptide repeat protein [Cyanobacteria bacterium P01_A01_bin.105]